MTIETPPEIDELPDNPSRLTSEEDEFVQEMDSWLAAQPTYRQQLIAMGEYVHDTAETVEGLAGNAQQSATSAANQVQLAADQVGLAAEKVQLAAGEVENAQTVADNVASQANFGGQWGDLAGSVAPPLSVYHSGQYWQLLVPLADVASVEPGTNANTWLPMVETAVDIGQVVYSFSDLSATGLFVEPGMSYLQSEYPELFSIVGIGDAPPISKVSGPASVPTVSRFTGVSYSGDGLYLGVTANNSGSDVFLYKLDTGTPALVDTLSSPVVGNLFCEFSPESDVLAVGGIGSNLAIYKRIGDSLSTSPVTVDQIPQSTVTGISFTADGVYMACSTEETSVQGVVVYKRSGDSFSTIYQKTGNQYKAISFTDDGQYLAASRSSSIDIIERTGDSFAVVDTLSLPGACNALHYSNDGMYLAAAHDSSPWLTVFQRNGSVHTKTANPEDLPGVNLETVKFSPDSRYLSATSNQAPYLFNYSFNAGVMVRQPNPSVPMPSLAYQLNYSPDSQFLAVANGSDFPYIYTGDYPFDVNTEFYIPDVSNLTPQSVGDWVPGVQGKPYVRAK